jgi:predicted RNA binding protein YcfA (HicA-like mRNA interferase family)
MSNYEKIWKRITSGQADRNIDFDDLIWLLEYKGFKKRHRGGSHVILTKPGVRERITYNRRVPRLKHIKFVRSERFC